MKYTIQYHIAGYGDPEGHDVEYHNSLNSISSALLRAHYSAECHGAGYSPSECIVWIGQYGDVADIYPDKLATTGPRGGVIFRIA